MHIGWYQRALSLVLCAGLGACGGSAGFELAMSLEELTGEATGLRVIAFESSPPCEIVFASGFGLSGIYDLEFDLGRPNTYYELMHVQEGTYTVAVWALDGLNLPIGFGCKENIVVQDGKPTTIEITVQDFPLP